MWLRSCHLHLSAVAGAAVADGVAELALVVAQDGVDLSCKVGETALHAAVRDDSREAVNLLLSAGANPNQQDVDGWTPLFGALSREVILTLREAGADPRITDQGGMGPEKWLKDHMLIQALTEKL